VADTVTAILAGAASLTVLVVREAITWARSTPPAPRETIAPAPPPTSQPSLQGLDVPALAARVERLERENRDMRASLDEEREGRSEIREMLAELRGEARARRQARERGGGGDGRDSR
jgi:hypothetical protein